MAQNPNAEIQEPKGTIFEDRALVHVTGVKRNSKCSTTIVSVVSSGRKTQKPIGIEEVG